MKLKSRIVLYFLLTIAMLKFTLSDKQLFDKLNKDTGFSNNKGSSSIKDNFIVQNNIMDFFQKVSLFLNRVLSSPTKINLQIWMLLKKLI